MDLIDGENQNEQKNLPSSSIFTQVKSDQKKKIIITISLTLILFIIGGSAYYLVLLEKSQRTSLSPVSMLTTPPTSNSTPFPNEIAWKMIAIQPTILPTFTFSPNITTWKIYNNQRYGFTLRYPPNYRIECADQLNLCEGDGGTDQSSAINFYPPKEQDDGYGSISVRVLQVTSTKKRPNESLDEYLKRSRNIGTYNRVSTKPIQIDGREALEIIDGEGGKERNIRTYVLHEDNNLIEAYFAEKKSIGFDYITPIINYPNVNEYYKVLSSLKFAQK